MFVDKLRLKRSADAAPHPELDEKRGLFGIKKSYSYLAYCFGIPVVLFFLIYLSMGLHPIANGSVLVLDLNGQYVYFYEALRNAVWGDTSLLYSFARQLGGEFLGIYAYYIASPFSYIVCLFPQDRMLEALLCIFLLKSGISGFTMGYYLHKTSEKLNKTNVIICSVLYAMCSYAVVQQHNSMWIDALMWLPLLTLGIEEMIKNYKYKLYVIMLALILMSNFYIGYMACIYTAAYFFYYYFAHNEDNRNNPRNETSHFAKSFLRIGAFSILAIGISMVIIASAYYSLQFGKNEFSNPNFAFSIRFDIMDFLTKFFPGSYDTVRPEGLPFVYCGVLTLFCVPLFFLSKKFSTREKVCAAVLIAFFVISFAVNTLDMVWHGFQKPNWLNYRYSFMLCFFLVTLAYKGMGQIRRASSRTVGFIGAILILFLAVAQKFTFHSVVERINGTVEFDQPLKDLEMIWLSVLCIVMVAIILCIMIRTKRRQSAALMLLVFVCIEAYGNGIINCIEFGNDVIYSSYSSYNDFVGSLRPLTEDILESDKTFYRFEKNVHRKYCDNMALNIRGLTNSTSTLNKSTINFLANIGYASKSHWSKYLGGNLITDSLVGIKYVIDKENSTISNYYDLTDLDPITYNKTAYYAYINNYALSLAYSVDSSVLDYQFTGKTPIENINSLLNSMLGSQEAHSYFVPVEVEESNANLTVKRNSSYIEYRPASSGSSATLTYTFTAPVDGEFFFYLPSDYPREVDLKVNGKANGTFYASETKRIVSLGFFDEGDTVSVGMTLKADVLYVTPNVNAVYYMDTELAREALSELASEQLTVSEGWSDDHITGTYTTSNDVTTVLTTIPYDEGWKIYVDGKKVEYTEALDALMAFEIEGAGVHTVEFKYAPVSFTLGLTVSVLSLVLFILIIIFEKPLAVIWDKVTEEVDVSQDEDAADESEPKDGDE
ncbi:MAG: YfhO family protein [Eubacteriales bacterium]